MAKPVDQKLPSRTTSEEVDEMIDLQLRQLMVPERLRDIEKWVAETKAKGDIRSQPDVRPIKDGGTFVSLETDLDSILEHCEAVRQKFRRGEFVLAMNSLNALNARVRDANARLPAEAAEESRRKQQEARQRGRAMGSQKLRDDAAKLRDELQKIADVVRGKRTSISAIALEVEKVVLRRIKEDNWSFREVRFGYIRKHIH